MTVALIALAGVLVGPPSPETRVPREHAPPDGAVARPPRWGAPLAIYCSGTALDLATTEAAIARGGRELNPLLRARGVRIPAKLAACVALSARDRRLQRRASTTPMRVTAVVLHAALVGWNLRQIARLR